MGPSRFSRPAGALASPAREREDPVWAGQAFDPECFDLERSQAGGGAIAAVSDGGAFGEWIEDEAGLPCFELRLPVPGCDVWHQVGNDRVTATAYADGRTVFYWAEEGLIRLGALLPPPGAVFAVRFGCGYAQWRWRAEGIEGVRRVWAPFGEAPGWRIDEELHGALPRAHTEVLCFSPRPIVGVSLMSRGEPPPRAFSWRERVSWRAMLALGGVSRAVIETLRSALGWHLRLAPQPSKNLPGVLLAPPGGPRPPSLRASWQARIPGAVFVAGLGEGAPQVRTVREGPRTTIEITAVLPAGASRVDTARDEPRTRVEIAAPLPPGTPHVRLSFGIGVEQPAEARGAIETLCAASAAETTAAWRREVCLDLPTAPALAREMRWHEMYLRSAQVRDTVLGGRYVPQGSAYGFIHGLHGAPRDYCISAVALTPFDPDAARETLRLCLRLVRPGGSVAYSHTGAGLPTSAAVHHAPSDLPLFLLWAASELVFAIGDRGLLDEARPVLLRTWRWLRDVVGVGAHGLLRVLSGDWNDPITSFAPSRRAFHRHGESAFNSAMAIFVLPRAAALLPEEAEEMHALAWRLRGAMEAAWAGEWFLRGFDGKGGAIGHDRLFLDSNAWCLIAGIGSETQRRALVQAIAERCDDPSPIGPTVLDRPARVRGGLLPPGWDTNGGVWAAISALTAWGVALHDPYRAWRLLEKQSLAAHARAYPHVWYGIWSGPDSWNSHLGERPGETFIQPATPMREFPVMNSNAHAGPLLALLRVLGIDATPEGLRVVRPAPEAAGAWSLATRVGRWAYSEAPVV